jgi:large subunit ribosomal protein L23
MATTKKVKTTKVAVTGNSAACLLLIKRPRITEKSGIQAETNGVYTFEVRPEATKTIVKKAITMMYNVVPTKVNIINLPAQNVFARGKRGVKSAVKKAVVYLKKGDKIEFV